MRKFSLRLFLFIVTALFCSVEAWGGSSTPVYVTAYAYSVPATKGWIWVTVKGTKFNASSDFTEDTFDSSQTSGSNWKLIGTPSNKKDFTATYYAKPKDGYSFAGWYSDSGCTTLLSSSTSSNCKYETTITSSITTAPGQTLTLYAKFAPKSYRVDFDANGGTCSTSFKSVTYDATYGSLPTPVLEGYTFQGWYTSASGGTNVNSSTTVQILSEQTLHAHWTINTYKVAFNGNGNTSGSMANQDFTYDAAQNLNANGYANKYVITYDAAGGTVTPSTEDAPRSFNGWSTSADGTVVYTNGQSVSNLTTTNNATVTLYAVWGGAASVVLPNPTKTNCVLEGWYDGATKVGDAGNSYTPTANVTLTARWISKYPFEMSGSDYALLVNQQQTPAFTFLHADNPTAHISNPAIFSYDALSNTITALGAGTASIYFTQAETSTIFSGTSATWTINVSLNPTTLTVKNSSLDLKVDDEVSGFVTTNSDVTITATSTDPTVAYYDAINNKIVAACAGEATITIDQPANAVYAAAAQQTVVVRVTKIDNTLSVPASRSMMVDDELTPVYSSKNSDGEVTTSSSDATVAYYDVANNKIVAPNSSAQSFDSKDVTIVINQAATYKYTAASETIQVTVKKHDNPLTVNGSANYATTLPYDNGEYLTITSDNNATRPAFVVNQTSGVDKATYYENAGNPYIWTSIYSGTASWTVDQAEDYKFKAGQATFSVTVAPAAEPNCYVLNDETDHNFATGIRDVTGHFDTPIEVNGVCDSLYFDARKDALGANYFVAQYSIDGGSSWVDIAEPDLGSSFATYGPYSVPENITHLRFGAKTGGTLSKYYKNVRVTRKTYLNADDLTIDEKSAGNAIYPGETGSNTLTIDWSLAGGGDLKIANDNPAEFTLSRDTIGDVDCAAGTTNITVQYKESDNQAGSSEAHLVIYNNVYRKEVTLTGITVKRDQAPVWNIDPVITLASEWTNVFESALSSLGVTYTFTPATGILELQGDKIVAVGAGDVTIHAHVDGNSEYNPIDADKTISVTTDQVQYISWDQNLMNLRWGEDDDIVLTATAQSDVVGCTTNGLRSVTYTSSDESVVRVEAGVLKVLAPGTATLTASVAAGTDADGHTYIAASTEKKVVVRDPSAPCEAFVYQQPSEYRFELGWNAANKQTKTQEISLGGLEPGYYSFDYKGEAKSVLIEYYDGTMTVEQYYDGAWHEVQNLGKPTKSSYRHTGDVALNRRATSIRVKVTNGLGYQYFNNMEITLARYIETSQDNIIFNSIIGENPSRTITIDYSNITDNIAISFVEPNAPFLLDKTFISGNCGDHDKNVPLTITYVPARPESDQTYTLRITDGTTTHDVLINATATLNEFIFEGTNELAPTDWQTSDNWATNDLPTRNDRVIIRSDVVLDSPLAAYEMLIENDATVTIAPTGGLSVGVGGVTGATVDNFIIQSDASHTGFFRMNPEAGTMPQATVQFYSKGADAGSEHDAVWQYFGVPVTNKGDGTLGTKKEHFFGSYVYLWNEQQGWQQKFSNSSLTPFEGYAITQNAATTYTLKGQLLNPNQDIALTKTPAGMDGDNVFANSYAAPIDVRTFTAEDFEGGAEMTFYLYNSGSWNQWRNAGSLEGSTPGQYTAIPVLASPALDPAHDVVTIAPMEGVYVQATAAGVIHLNYDKHVWRAKPDMPTNNPRHLRRAGAVETSEAQEEPLFVLDRRVRLEVVAEDGSSDRIYLLQSETFSPAYDNGFDAPKVFSDGLLGFYANCPDGQMSVASTDDILGLQLGFHAGDAANYTLHVTSVLGEEVALRDQLTNEVVLLEDGATYAFSAPAHSQNAQRFEVVDAALYRESQMHQEGVATSLEQLSSAAEGTMLAVYDAAGRLITTVPYAGSLMHSVQALPAGVYMVQAADKVLKIVK